MAPKPRPAAERFWEKVVKTSGCWLWSSGSYHSGYGQFWASGRGVTAHRMSWTLVHGPIPTGMCVCHKCDVKLCVRPDHLFLGTSAENTADSVSKDRRARGERHPMARLNWAKVRKIRALRARGSKWLSEKYGVTREQINNILSGRHWRE